MSYIAESGQCRRSKELFVGWCELIPGLTQTCQLDRCVDVRTQTCQLDRCNVGWLMETVLSSQWLEVHPPPFALASLCCYA